MIRVERVPKPRDFDEVVKEPGKRWLRENPTAKRPKDLWTPYRSRLADGFGRLCGYAAMHDPTDGTVDHYLSFKNYPKKAYEWGNYRFASETMNKSKRNADDSVLDPFEVGEGWFEILLPSLQLISTDRVPVEMRAKVENTIRCLKLQDGERVIRWRKSWYDEYLKGGLTLDALRRFAPLIADAIERHQAVHTD